MSLAAAEAMQEIRQILSMPDKVAQQWFALQVPQRQALLKSAALPVSYAMRAWVDIPEDHRELIRAAARRARDWALKLEL